MKSSLQIGDSESSCNEVVTSTIMYKDSLVYERVPFHLSNPRDHLTLTEMIGSESICMIKRLVIQHYSRDREGVTIEPELTP